MDIEYTQDIYYSNKQKIPISEVARSLLALEEASSVVPTLIETIFDDVSIKSMSIYIEELESGSLKERVQYYLWIALQNNLENNSEIEYKNLSNETGENKRNIIGWALAATLIIALKFAADRAFPNEEKPYLQEQINITFQAGRDITGIDSEKLLGTVKTLVKENPQAIKGAIGFTNPAKKEKNAHLKIGTITRLTSELLKEVPAGLFEEEEQERVIELTDTEVFIRATDKDSGKKGWGATVPEFSEKRVRMHIAPGIDLEFLSHQDVIVGDVAIFYLVTTQGNVKKPHIHLYSINEEETRRKNGQP